MAANYKGIAEELIALAGGRENIISAMHCATRLRLILKDRSRAEDKKIEQVDMVKGIVYTAGQYQIILGTGTVNKVYAEVLKLGIGDGGEVDEELDGAETRGGHKTGAGVAAGGKQGASKRLVRLFGDIFVPLIPVLAATGLCLAVQGVITNDMVLKLFGTSAAQLPASFVTILNALCNTVFDFLPALICWSAFRIFGGTPLYGFVIGLMLVNPALPNAYAVAKGNAEAIRLFGFIPIVAYQGSVLPAIIAGAAGAKVEKEVQKHMPDALDYMFTPFLTIILTLIASLCVIGPVFHTMESGILWGVEKILYLPFGVGSFLVAFAHPFLVITGVHHIFNALEIGITAAGSLNAFRTLVIIGTTVKACAVLAITLKMKNRRMKSAGYSAMTSQFLGIGEPAIFGFLIRYSFRPLVLCTLVGAAASAVAMVLHVDAQGMGVNGLLGILLYLYEPGVMVKFILINLAAGAGAFVVTWLFGVPKEFLEERE